MGVEAPQRRNEAPWHGGSSEADVGARSANTTYESEATASAGPRQSARDRSGRVTTLQSRQTIAEEG